MVLSQSSARDRDDGVAAALSRDDAIFMNAVSRTRRDGPGAVRSCSKSKKRPTSSEDGDDARRWREGAAAPRDAESRAVDVEQHHLRLRRLQDQIPELLYF